MANTKARGEISEAVVMARLLRCGEVVLRPFGDSQRYDLVLDRNGEFVRVQVKTGRLKNGSIKFETRSGNRVGKHRNYFGQVELFGVYCPDNDSVYLVPVEDVGQFDGTLRIQPAKNNQADGIRWAHSYVI